MGCHSGFGALAGQGREADDHHFDHCSSAGIIFGGGGGYYGYRSYGGTGLGGVLGLVLVVLVVLWLVGALSGVAHTPV